jgi:hypothetical protein
VFWAPVAVVTWLTEGAGPAVQWPLVGALALHQHVRTTLAPYGAVHGNVHPTRATLVSWRLGGTHFGVIAGILVLGFLPVGGPLLGLYWAVVWLGPAELSTAAQAVGSQLFGVLLQCVRPVLIPALHRCYEDVWPHAADST